MKEFLKQAFSSNESVSIMRILTVFVVLDIMATWTVTCIKDMDINDIPWGVVAVLGAMIGGKAVQKFGERPQSDVDAGRD
jgi:hypothetical protein